MQSFQGAFLASDLNSNAFLEFAIRNAKFIDISTRYTLISSEIQG
jgi:hypothetical protein